MHTINVNMCTVYSRLCTKYDMIYKIVIYIYIYIKTTCMFETYVKFICLIRPTNPNHSFFRDMFVGADLHGEARVVNHSSGARVQPGSKGLQVGEAQKHLPLGAELQGFLCFFSKHPSRLIFQRFHRNNNAGAKLDKTRIDAS